MPSSACVLPTLGTTATSSERQAREKTTLLRNLLLQHLALGHGFALIDPHGDLAEEILQHVPRWRTDHVVYFNPGDRDFPIAFNPLANVPHDQQSLAVSGIVSALKNLWPDSWGPRMEFILQNAVAALLEADNTSLLGVNRMLTDKVYRDHIVRQVRDPFVRDYWTREFESYDPRFRREAIAPIQNKLGQFLMSPITRNILGQVKNRIDIPFIMDHGRIFIANLSQGKIGADKANLLGSLLVSQFQIAAMARSNIPESDRRDFFLFADEFQNFTTDAFVSLLSEARKYRLNLTLAHQYMAQLKPEIRDAVLGNVGTMIAFRVGYNDAEQLQNELARDFDARQFVELGKFEIIVRLHRNGQPQVPFRGVTLPPIVGESGLSERAIARSRDRFATLRGIVEDKLSRWIG
ncbi:MAG: hypothetical protein ACI9R3_004401 [Verrucomicrobiales bacterium]